MGATAGIHPSRVAVKEICERQPLSSAVVGVLAIDMNGDTLACVNPRTKMIPASNVKLITTGLALRTLGEDYHFKTSLAYSGEIVGGVLKGDLYIIGGGDPTTGSKSLCADPVDYTFGEWKSLMDKAGIGAVEGRVIADPRYFDASTTENLGWTYDDLGTNYGAGPSGLNFFENAQNFLVTPGAAEGESPKITVRYPETPWMKFINSAVTGKSRSANTLYYLNTHLAAVGEFGGSFPVDRKGYTLECSNRFASYTCAVYFCNYLKNKGIVVKKGAAHITPDGRVCLRPGTFGEGESAASADSLTNIGASLSPRLSAIVRETNHESDNFFAETLLLEMAHKGGLSCRDGRQVEAAEAALRALGVKPEGSCRLFDGSGLSRKNYISADFFVRYLRAMAATDSFDVFLSSLPSPGEKGTLEHKFPNNPPEWRKRIKMKSGSMNGVYCYSGYILSSDGDPSKMIVFSLLTNNVTASSWATLPSIDAIITALAAEN